MQITVEVANLMRILAANTFVRRALLLALALSSLLSYSLFFATPVSAQVITHRGPSDTGTRYALEYSNTTQATTINVPVFFPTQPGGAKSVTVNSFRLGMGGLGVRFNGGPTLSSAGSFTIPAGNFVYDPITGYWKANINAVMTGYSGLDPDHFIHFRMELADTSGYIAYGGGSFQAVSVNYPDSSIPSELYSLYMATPCDIRANTVRNVQFYDLDHENDDNNWDSVTVRITDTTTGAVVATRVGDSYPVAMGQAGVLTISMTFVPGHRYRVDLWNISANNVIRYNFPFDNIAYAVPVCPTPQWDTSGTSVPSPSGLVTTATPNVTFTHEITNDAGSYDATDEIINAEIFQRVNSGAWVSIDTFSQAIGLPVGSSFSRNSIITTGSNVGNVICQYVSWSPNAWDSSATEQTAPACVTIAGLPKMSIVGSDASAGGSGAVAGFSGSSQSSNFGSSGEYGLFATGAISDFTSAGKIYPVVPGPGTMPLAFANNITPAVVAGSSSATGYYQSTRTITDLISKYATRGAAGSAYGGGIIPASGDYRVTTDIDIDASNLPVGRRVLIYAPANTVTITDNITYTTAGPTLNSFADAPMLVVIARNILVNQNVTQLDGVFAATDAFTSCSEAGVHPTDVQVNPAVGNAAISSGGTCDTERLTVNGAVIARRVILPRTAGGSIPGDAPAEVFRLRPEAYLTPQLIFSSSTPLMTVSETELPARN
jgi:hypothetical protein